MSTNNTRKVTIREDNAIARTLFNTQVEYVTDALPEWFQALRYVFEDASFTSMHIQLKDVHYFITLAEETAPGKPYRCYDCGRALAFPETLFYRDNPYCFEHVPEYHADEQF